MCRSSFNTPLRITEDYSRQKTVFHEKRFAQIWAFTHMCQQQADQEACAQSALTEKQGWGTALGLTPPTQGQTHCSGMIFLDPSTWKWPPPSQPTQKIKTVNNSNVEEDRKPEFQNQLVPDRLGLLKPRFVHLWNGGDNGGCPLRVVFRINPDNSRKTFGGAPGTGYELNERY